MNDCFWLTAGLHAPYQTKFSTLIDKDSLKQLLDYACKLQLQEPQKRDEFSTLVQYTVKKRMIVLTAIVLNLQINKKWKINLPSIVYGMKCTKKRAGIFLMLSSPFFCVLSENC